MVYKGYGMQVAEVGEGRVNEGDSIRESTISMESDRRKHVIRPVARI